MSEFIDFIHKEEKERARTEEEQLAIHKKQQRLREQAMIDDEFYDEELDEAVRVPFRSRRPAPQKQQMEDIVQDDEPTPQYCVPRPTRQDIQDTENDIKQYGVIPPKRPKRELDFDPGFNESVHQPVKRIVQRQVTPVSRPSITENPVLREAYKMMDGMKKKIEDMFYQYGMTGLEKLNESMLDVFEDILNPPVREPEPRIVERVVEVPVQPKVTPKKKVLKKKPTVTQKPQIDEEVEIAKPVKPAKLVIKNTESDKETLKRKCEAFEELNNTANFDALANCLAEQKIKEQTTESEAVKKLKQINARAEMLKKTMEESNKAKVTKIEAQQEEEPYEQPEEFDIVEDTDSTDIDLETIETETNEEN